MAHILSRTLMAQGTRTGTVRHRRKPKQTAADTTSEDDQLVYEMTYTSTDNLDDQDDHQHTRIESLCKRVMCGAV